MAAFRIIATVFANIGKIDQRHEHLVHQFLLVFFQQIVYFEKTLKSAVLFAHNVWLVRALFLLWDLDQCYSEHANFWGDFLTVASLAYDWNIGLEY